MLFCVTQVQRHVGRVAKHCLTMLSCAVQQNQRNDTHIFEKTTL